MWRIRCSTTEEADSFRFTLFVDTFSIVARPSDSRMVSFSQERLPPGVRVDRKAEKHSGENVDFWCVGCGVSGGAVVGLCATRKRRTQTLPLTTTLMRTGSLPPNHQDSKHRMTRDHCKWFPDILREAILALLSNYKKRQLFMCMLHYLKTLNLFIKTKPPTSTRKTR